MMVLLTRRSSMMVMQTLTNGAGAYIGLPKAINGAEIDLRRVPASITYNAYLNEDGTMSVTVEAGDGVGGITYHALS